MRFAIQDRSLILHPRRRRPCRLHLRLHLRQPHRVRLSELQALDWVETGKTFKITVRTPKSTNKSPHIRQETTGVVEVHCTAMENPWRPCQARPGHIVFGCSLHLNNPRKPWLEDDIHGQPHCIGLRSCTSHPTQSSRRPHPSFLRNHEGSLAMLTEHCHRSRNERHLP